MSAMLTPAWPGERAAPPLTVQLVRELVTALLVVECTCALRPAPGTATGGACCCSRARAAAPGSRGAALARQAACTAGIMQDMLKGIGFAEACLRREHQGAVACPPRGPEEPAAAAWC